MNSKAVRGDETNHTGIVLRTASPALRSRIAELLDFMENDAVVIYAAENENVTYNFKADAAAIYNIIVIVEKGGRMELNCEVSSMSQIHRHAVVCEGSRLIINDFVVSADCVEMNTRIDVKQEANVQNVALLLGGDRSVLDYTVNFTGEGAESEQWGLMMIDGDERATFKVAANHRVASCRSNELIKIVASQRAYGEFKGMVYVAPDAQHTEALQQSKNILLGDDCQVITSPQLEIYADDVKCSHGATTGQIDGDSMFYMRQRGLDENEARRLQLLGFVSDIVERYSNEELRERAMSRVSVQI